MLRSLASTPSFIGSRSAYYARIGLASLLLALCAQIRVPLPFTPVPITLQTLCAMILGGMLGRRGGALCIIFYLAEAMVGLPVLSGGRSDPLFLLSPVGGYLIGFVIQAYVAGWFVEKRQTLGAPLMILGLGISCILELALGTVWLGGFVGMKNALICGAIPFLPGELIKIAIAAVFFKNETRS